MEKLTIFLSDDIRANLKDALQKAARYGAGDWSDLIPRLEHTTCTLEELKEYQHALHAIWRYGAGDWTELRDMLNELDPTHESEHEYYPYG